jgi:hypothetical protein
MLQMLFQQKKYILRVKNHLIDNEIDSRIDAYLKDKSIAVDFPSAMSRPREELSASAK